MKSIAAGYWHNLAIKSTNSVVAWGLNVYSQTNVPSGLKAIAVAAGRDHSLALTTNGTVVGWGINSNYFNSDPSQNEYFGQADIPLGLSNVVAIAAGAFHSAALESNGTVICWGYNFYGQTNVPADLTNAIAIACGNSFSLALRSDGTVEGWGDNFYGQIDIPTDLTNIVAIAAGGFHGLALKADGTVEGWGYDFYGQADSPTDLTNAVAVAAGYTHSIALRNDGTVTAWGDDTYGQINVQTNKTSGLHSVLAIAGGYSYSLALTNDSPLITTDLPANVTTNAGATVHLTVGVTGATPLTYRWWFNNALTVSNNSSSLTLSNLTTASDGNYFVVVSNAIGSVTSSVVTLTIVNVGAPIIVTNPASKTVNLGGSTNFAVAAIGNAPLNYQWWMISGTTNSYSTNLITGATNSFYTVSNAQATDAGNYFVVVTNLVSSATSSVAILTVRLPPTITNDLPASMTTNAGATVHFILGVTGATPLTYKWWFNNALTVSNNLSSLTISNLTTVNAGNYFVVVSNVVGSATSSVVTLAVVDVGAPIIVTNPASKTVNLGGSTNFMVTAIGSAPLSYQWWVISGTTNSYSTNLITDATNSLYTVSNAQATDAGNYFVVVTNLVNSATSSVAVLTVRLPPAITNDLPANVTTNAYTTVIFKIGVTGATPLTYKWWFNNALTVSNNLSSLTLNNVTSNNIGNYFVVISNVVGSVTSSVVALSVIYNPSLTPAQLYFLSHSGLNGDSLMIAMEAGKNYRVQATTNLQSWFDVTNFLSTSTLMDYTNSLSTNADTMFYRVVSP